MKGRVTRSCALLQMAHRGGGRGLRGHRAAVSLHAHSWYSRESLVLLDDLAARLPVVRALAAREIERSDHKCGHTVAVARGACRPPLPPERSAPGRIGCTIGARTISSA